MVSAMTLLDAFRWLAERSSDFQLRRQHQRSVEIDPPDHPLRVAFAEEIDRRASTAIEDQ